MEKYLLDDTFVGPCEMLSSSPNNATLTILRNNYIAYSLDYHIDDNYSLSYFHTKKLILTLLWTIGGDHILFKGNHDFYLYLKKQIGNDEEIQKSFKEIQRIFSKEVVLEEINEEYPKITAKTPFISYFDGNLIGLDLGGSDRKLSVIKDGKLIYSEEMLWNPKEAKDPAYQYNGILESLEKGRSLLPHIDSIGISVAGVVRDNELLSTSLYASVNEEEKYVCSRDVFKKIISEHFADIPYSVFNDGDVSAIGASLYFKKSNVLGLSLGTSLAGGFIKGGNLFNWLNELSKVPLNYSPDARKHYSLDISGAAGEYLSQKGIISLVEEDGIKLSGTLANKLKEIQRLAEEGNDIVLSAYHDIGLYLGEALRFFYEFYHFESVLLLGRVMSGRGGEIIKDIANKYLLENGLKIDFISPDEDFIRLGQSYIVSSLRKYK